MARLSDRLWPIVRRRNVDDIVSNGEANLFPKHIEEQNQFCSLQLWVPSIASIIKDRHANIARRATQIIEFKKVTPKPQSPRFHRTHKSH